MTVHETITGLPMPRQPELLAEASQRPHVLHARGPRFPFPIPNGWFVVPTADELAGGEHRSLHYFGRDLVLFRTAGGDPRLLDAHCPHLGAHIGVGGRVEDDCIRCPFHGWRFDGASGRCVEIPYAPDDRIPARAATRSHPMVERNGLLWAWHHRLEKPPAYEVPFVAEFDDPDWTPMDVREFEVATCCQEMAENNVDYSHFKFVHGSDAIPENDFHVDGHYKRTVGADGNFVREGFGLGLGVLRVAGTTTFISSTTPIDEEHLHIRWAFTSPRSLGDEAAREVADMFCAGVSQDIPIWENKVFRPRPLLTKSERPVTEQRRWAEQFYSYLPGEERP